MLHGGNTNALLMSYNMSLFKYGKNYIKKSHRQASSAKLNIQCPSCKLRGKNKRIFTLQAEIKKICMYITWDKSKLAHIAEGKLYLIQKINMKLKSTV